MSEFDPEREDAEREEVVLKCGYPGCCIPGYHFRHECHNAEDLMRMEKALEKIVEVDRARATRNGDRPNA